MYEELIESFQAEARNLASSQRAALDALQNLEDANGATFDVATQVGTSDRTISDLDTLTSSLIKFAEGFREDKNWSFVPRTWIADFRDGIKNTASSYDNLAANISAVDNQHGGIESINATAFSVETQDGTEIDFRKLLNAISVNIDEAFACYFRMRPAISAPRLSEFGDLFGIFNTRKSELDGLSRELNRIAKQSHESAEAIEAAAKEVSADRTLISKSKDDSIRTKTEIEEAAAEATTAIETIEATSTSASALAKTVDEYRSEFDKFQKDLAARNADYLAKKNALEKLKAALDEERDRIEQISAQAEDMLKGATNAGLAASFSKKQGNIELELMKARRAYYISIGLLVFLTLPIFIYSFPREYIAEFLSHAFGLSAPQLLGRDTSQPEYQQILNFVGRAIFLVPGLMFVRFASSRHARLFRLREDYAYKYSIASSVDGFMKQAKSYSDDIAAACYYELTYNPADYMDEKSDDSRMMNPLFEKMMTRLESRMVRKKPRKSAKTEEAQATAILPRTA